MIRPLLLTLAAVVCSCNSPASGLFVVTDVSPFFRDTRNGPRLAKVRLQVFDGATATTPVRTQEFENPSFPLSFSIQPSKRNGTYRLELSGLADGVPTPLYLVRRIVTMQEGEVRAVSIPVRGHCATARCTNVGTTCFQAVGACEGAAVSTRAYTEGLDNPCPNLQMLDESFTCISVGMM